MSKEQDIENSGGRPRRTVGVCIATCRRPEGLRKLLLSVGRQQFKKVLPPAIYVFIADNDPGGSAGRIVEAVGASFRHAIEYSIVEKRGIPFVRNRLVTMARECDLIAFVDDDEEVESNWLDEMLFTMHQSGAPVVTGPVIGRFESLPPRWAVDGRFYDSARHATGRDMSIFYTGNVIMERGLLDHYEKPFEESMALCGGTDALLAMRLIDDGARCVWCDDAVVNEDIPTSRVNMRWYLRRRFRIGNSSVYCRRIAGRRSSVFEELLRAMHNGFLGIAVCGSSVWRGRHKIVRGLGYMFTGVGIIFAVLKFSSNEYGRADYE